MRGTHRSLALVPAFLLSLVAVPAYAVDDSPGLLGTVGSTVDALTRPIIVPKAPPASPAPTGQAGPVKQLTTIVDTVVGGKTSLGDLALVAVVDAALIGNRAPAAPSPVTATPGVVTGTPSAPARDAAMLVTALPDVSTASRPTIRAFAVIDLAATSSTRPARVEPAAANEIHVAGTSTLPDGGSPLTTAWLVLAVGITCVGATVIRRARTA